MEQEKTYIKMVLRCETNTVGTDSVEFYLVPTDVTQEELDNFASEKAMDNAASYGIYPPPSNFIGYEDDDDEDYDEYDDNICGHFEEYDSKEHDGFAVGNNGPHWEVF